jgi:hypothetical protein
MRFSNISASLQTHHKRERLIEKLSKLHRVKTETSLYDLDMKTGLKAINEQ